MVCWLQAVLGELIPGGVPRVITTARTARVLRAIRPDGVVQAARCELAAALLDDLRRIDTRTRETRKKLAVTIAAAGTSLTGPFGVGPVNAAAVIGDVRDVSAFPAGTTLPPTTAPCLSRAAWCCPAWWSGSRAPRRDWAGFG